ncbi:hypothetical protein RCH09_000786 [Actimicrobium sp. GrIS 1.19]|uniref:DUF4148 domain-containing protein n=1 Tax=Actimicrobium sp. GrIS 1.19 TaxID=3071708 RepID=UPI002E0B28CB|nr:hypothetical protein [Actimicrobium sp. GrIS 1.19]
MNIKQLFAAIALISATGAVFAADLMPFTEADNFKSSKTRAEVKAEVLRANQQSMLAHGDLSASDLPAVATKSTRDRSEVRKEAIESAKNQKSDTNRPIGS